MNVINQKPPIV